jgi:hypothetical protein
MTRALLQVLLLSLGIGGGAVLTGCSTFARDWQAMGAIADDADAHTVTAALALEGRWKGTWHSDVNDHSGKLRCIVTTDEEGELQARYHATYGCCFTFEYAMPMAVRQEGEVYHFSAEADLGWLAGGLYEYEGQVVGDEYTSTYSCERDNGTFQMKRVD